MSTHTSKAIDTSSSWDREVDLLVIGAGAGGMTAALVGSLEKLEVLLVEKTAQVGGTAATSAGSLWIPGNSQGVQAGLKDSAEEAARYLVGLQGESATSSSVQKYLECGPDVIDYLERLTDVKFLAAGYHPDYRDLPGAGSSGRVIVPQPFDGRLLGPEFHRVRPPIEEFLLFGGMMVGKMDLPPLIDRYKSIRNLTYAAKLMLRYLTDRLRYPRGTRLMMGNALVARLYYSLIQRRVPTLFDVQLGHLIRADDGVQGAALIHNGNRLRVRARRGVVLSTGGFGHHEGLRREFMPTPTPPRSLAAMGSTGDGVTQARAIGAHVDAASHRDGAFWTPVSVTTRKGHSQGLFPHLLLDRAKPGLIAVNAAGQRFVNEGDSYHDFVSAMIKAHRDTPTIPAWLVCTADFVRKYGLGHIYPGTRHLGPHERNGYVVTAPTLSQLAQKIGVDASGLEESARRMNAFARTGVDLDFGKGSTALNRTNGDPEVAPNPCLGPLDQPPYCAMAVWPAEIAASTGLEADANARVLDGEGTPIPGLYACGNDMASIFRGTYPGPGTTLGPAMVFAWRAAMHAARVDEHGEARS